MAKTKAIHDFAKRWFKIYRSASITEKAMETFAAKCLELGFEMDCGKAFEEVYPNPQAFSDYIALNKIITQIQDAQFLGTAIFSKYQDYLIMGLEEQLLSPENRFWFIIALERMITITANKEKNPYVYKGKPQKIQLISNNISYGIFPKLDEEIEQRLTINANGGIWFSGYTLGQDHEKYDCSRRTNYSIDKEVAFHILNMVCAYFSNEYETQFASDIGSWKLKITSEMGETYQFAGSLCCNFAVNGINLSNLIRNVLDMPWLFVFDGNGRDDAVRKIMINYHKTQKIEGNTDADAAEYYTVERKEHLVIHRNTEMIIHTHWMGAGRVISQKYYLEDAVGRLLDTLNPAELFAHPIENCSDCIDDPLETRKYEIVVDFYIRPQLVLKGSYDKNGLPEDFSDFASKIINFINYYGKGEILNPSFFMQVKRKTGDYIFCSVEFHESGKSYYYLSEDDTLEIGDYVVVPVGNHGKTAVVKIVDIAYFPEDEIPFPLDKVKSIIEKCEDEGSLSETLDEESIALDD